jgi:hypothetical protein
MDEAALKHEYESESVIFTSLETEAKYILNDCLGKSGI